MDDLLIKMYEFFSTRSLLVLVLLSYFNFGLISVSETGFGDEQSQRDVQKDHCCYFCAVNLCPCRFRIPTEEAVKPYLLGDKEGGQGTSENEDVVGNDGVEALLVKLYEFLTPSTLAQAVYPFSPSFQF